MGFLTSAPTQSPIMTMTTPADSVAFTFPLAIIRWVFTTAVTSTWSLAMSQSSSVAGSTAPWPLLGTTASVFAPVVASTVYFPTGGLGAVDFPIYQWVFGAVLTSISGGHVELIVGKANEPWVVQKPFMLTTVQI